MIEESSFPATSRLLQEALTLQALLNEIESSISIAMMPSVRDKKSVVDLYTNRLRTAVDDGTADDLIKACNAFTSVNKGLADAPWIDDFPGVSEQALKVSHQAWTAGDEARQAANHP